MKRGEIAYFKQFLIFSSFLPYMALIFHLKCTLKCRRRFVSTWTSLKFYHLVMGGYGFENKLRKASSVGVFSISFLLQMRQIVNVLERNFVSACMKLQGSALSTTKRQ